VRILAGTSGWSYPAWKGGFYPADLASSRMLQAYAARLPTVEVNNTFYRMPRKSMLAAWRAEAPPGFLFALKAPQRITHRERLVGSLESLGYFREAAAELGEALGPLLFQLPPFLRKDLPRLREFLALLPRGGRVAFEFRHESWFVPEVLTALADAGAALCAADTEEGATPLVATAPYGYLRLRRPEYDDAAMGAWLERIHAQPWSDAFVYFKHEDARGPAYALRLAALEAGRAGAGAQPAADQHGGQP
jgi:uncharacterized protein YecE (DUF72 family)